MVMPDPEAIVPPGGTFIWFSVLSVTAGGGGPVPVVVWAEMRAAKATTVPRATVKKRIAIQYYPKIPKCLIYVCLYISKRMEYRAKTAIADEKGRENNEGPGARDCVQGSDRRQKKQTSDSRWEDGGEKGRGSLLE